MKKPGETSHVKLSKNLSLPIRKVTTILDILEKSRLIFSVKPHIKSANSFIRKPWKYYFISSSIVHSLRSFLGLHKEEGKGLLLETAIASYLFKIANKNDLSVKLKYDSSKNGNVDFLFVNTLGKITPIECGFGKKTSQVKKAMKKYNSQFGFIITDANKITITDNIIKIPYHILLSF